ncbi:MAG: F0F1 ATP synthase subunit gamma [Holosporales bacterium]|jgi:F-type H+-transporting ATPase subunit gamma|nr:F0F1 ATP synthase subunit gamma [Holosporales bacterium]
MENLKAIKNRIRTIDSIVKATNAMKMVATANLSRISNSNKFSKKCCDALLDMISKAVSEAAFENRLDQDSWVNRKSGKTLIVILSTDQGFCGSFRQAITEAARKVTTEYGDSYIEIFGKKGLLHTKNRSVLNVESIRMSNVAEFARLLAEVVMKYVLHHEVLDVFLISGKMRNMLSQIARCTKILPIERSEVLDSEYVSVEGPRQEFINSAFNMYISRLLVAMVTEHLVAEYAARVMAMDSSVRNANSIRDKLSVLYNNIRQAKITQELTEIVASIECVQ